VAGKREGVILETELKHNAGYRNFYEESKYLAELEVDSAKNELPITIHRPAVVCGDSQTGETGKYDGVYYLIHYLLRWPGGLSLMNIGNHVVSLNLVPVDFVVDAMAALAFDERAIGKTLQLADPSPLTTNQLFKIDRRSPFPYHRSGKVGTLLPDVAALAANHRTATPRCPVFLRETTLRHDPGARTPRTSRHSLPTIRKLRRSHRRLRPPPSRNHRRLTIPRFRISLNPL
jgi:thioester reductase-like protein